MLHNLTESAPGGARRALRSLLWLGLAFVTGVVPTEGHAAAREEVSPPDELAANSPPQISTSFDSWLRETKKPTARAMTAHFIEASRIDAGDYEKTLDSLAAKLRVGGGSESPKERAARIRSVVFEQESFRASTDLTNLENLLPQRIVARKTGYCIGLTLVLLDLCERVGWEATAVSAPRHTFLRLLGKDPVHLETTLAGAVQDEEWYRSRFSIGDRPATLRALSIRELGGHLLNNVAYSTLDAGETAAAEALIERSLKLDPKGVEAITNLGVCRAREGDFEAALTAFSRTLELWPGDPTTRLNRVNALLPLGRRSDAISELVSLLAAYPRLSSLTQRAKEIRDQLEVHRDWEDRQRLTMALVEQEVLQRKALPGLQAVYHHGTDLANPKLRRIDRTLEFQWGRGSPASAIPRDRFSARWTGWLSVPHDDTYTFLISCSDGIRIWIDGRRVIDAWSYARDNFPKGDIELLAGRHEFRVEYFESNGTAGLLMILISGKESNPYELSTLLSHPGPVPEPEREGSKR